VNDHIENATESKIAEDKSKYGCYFYRIENERKIYVDPTTVVSMPIPEKKGGGLWFHVKGEAWDVKACF
jgi:hypothetical protein